MHLSEQCLRDSRWEAGCIGSTLRGCGVVESADDVSECSSNVQLFSFLII